jgi:hypothetical protein
MKLPTPDCPWCSQRTEDRGDRFGCAFCAREPLPLPVPEAWYRDLAAAFGRNAFDMAARWPVLPDSAYIEARWAARAAMRACPELRG